MSSPESRDEAREKALATFMEYFRTNYPGPDTIICKPDWHAPKIFRAVEAALAASRSERGKPIPPSLAVAVGNAVNKLNSLGRTFSGPNFTDRHQDGPHCLMLAKALEEHFNAYRQGKA
jgi:hypothetical protein